jgi:hypothetical protein
VVVAHGIINDVNDEVIVPRPTHTNIRLDERNQTPLERPRQPIKDEGVDHARNVELKAGVTDHRMTKPEKIKGKGKMRCYRSATKLNLYSRQ